jgi:DUF1680 family protein
MKQETAYPYEGTIRFCFDQTEKEEPWKLMVRVPAWADSGAIDVNGVITNLDSKDRGTYREVMIYHTEGTVVELTLTMETRFTVSNSMVEETENHVAIERGPLVYCMESPDADVSTLDDLIAPADGVFQTEEYQIEGRTVMALRSDFWCLKREDYDRTALYQTLGRRERKRVGIRLIPYFAWDNRGMGEMRIWFPVAY